MARRKEKLVKSANSSIGRDSKRVQRQGYRLRRILKARRAAIAQRSFVGKGVPVVTLIVATTLVCIFLIARRPPATSGQANNAGSPAFANPDEIRFRPTENRLLAIMEIVSGQYLIPSVGSETLRQYRGWDPANPIPPNPNVSPGPTLRARLGDQVQISFLNKIDDSQFPYSFDTEPKPGLSSFGCDRSGTFDTATGTYLPYPANDIFPNCFHGSSTANIHFHGMHTSPDGLSDNVLVQVLPQLKQPDWTNTFNTLFNSRTIPQKWTGMPLDYQNAQAQMIAQHDTEAAAAAAKNGLPKPESLSAKNQELIASGQWPEYIMGAFPNFFEIPDYDAVPNKYKAGQAPGTHWYHAHKHGSTSLHIRNGLAGALIIESSRDGGYDHFIRKTFGWGTTYGNHEKILVFQELDATANLERGGKSGQGLGPGESGGKGSSQVLVNGLLMPTINMAPFEVQLWRMINATEGNGSGIISTGSYPFNQPNFLSNISGLFQTVGFKFMQTAMDGVQFSPTNFANQPFLNPPPPSPTPSPTPGPPNRQVGSGGIVLASGNRADLLVQAPPTPGVYAFKNGNGNTLFFVNVAGPNALTQQLPLSTWATMPKFLNDLPAPPVRQTPNVLQFQWETERIATGRAGGTERSPVYAPPRPNNKFPPHFMINGKQFAQTGEVVDQCMPQDALQDWILENYTPVVAHPFHIHINPFQVIRIDTPTALNTYQSYAPPNNYIWQDVIAIPPAVMSADGKTVSPGRVRIRQTFVDFTGTFVLHCHILAHEDRGMMQLVRVVPAANYPKGCQGPIPAHH
jgi:FtsP/CotA-like multicopper oxidase with cupredoxin domain